MDYRQALIDLAQRVVRVETDEDDSDLLPYFISPQQFADLQKHARALLAEAEREQTDAEWTGTEPELTGDAR